MTSWLPQGLARILRALIIVLTPCLFVACASHVVSVQERNQSANGLANQYGWDIQTLNSGSYALRVFVGPKYPRSNLLSIYLEGDGHAWDNTSSPSANPTPIQAMALALAVRQPNGSVAALERPCQYIGVGVNPLCTSAMWTSKRYDPSVIDSMNTAIDQLKRHFGVQTIELVAYSGGAAIAIILAARRNDVLDMITVAGNVDPNGWAKYHALDPLLNADTRKFISQIAKIPQVYYVGSNDEIVPSVLAKDFSSLFPEGYRPRVIEVGGMGHSCCWADKWPDLWLNAHNAMREGAK